MITNKKFNRFWKWYKNLIPEVEEYTKKTEEMLMELLESVEKEQSDKRDNEIRGEIGKLLGRMRYSRSPKLTEKEIRRELMVIIAASNSFERTMKRTREIYEEYLESETESLVSTNISEEETDEWYEDLQQIIKDHIIIHDLGTESSVRDLSCEKCFPKEEEMKNDEQFMIFWKWYSEMVAATSYSGETFRIFGELKKTFKDVKEKDTEEITLVLQESIRLTRIFIMSVRYQRKPDMK